MSTVAIITARGGSKRIPKKNIKLFCGKPIISYSIEAALRSGCFDEVMVSTDSDEIAEAARAYGATVPFMRGAAASGDFATTADVLEEVLQQYKELLGRDFETMCCLYPTAPFVTAEKLRNAMALLDERDAESVMPVVRFGYPPQRGVVIKGGLLRYQYPEYERSRSQDLEPVYHDCGQFYLCRTAAFLRYRSLVMPQTVPFVVPEEEAQDIDTLSDWRLAELKYQKFLAKEAEGYVPAL